MLTGFDSGPEYWGRHHGAIREPSRAGAFSSILRKLLSLRSSRFAGRHS